MADEELKKLLAENLTVSREILEISKSTRRYIMMGRLMGLLKLVVIVIPIILGIIYLPPLIKDLLAFYQDLLGGVTGLKNVTGSVQNIQQGMPDMKGMQDMLKQLQSGDLKNLIK